MTHHRLPAGTDIAGIALFDVDALPPSRMPDEDELRELASQGRLVEFPIDGDGAYLLHLFVNEPVSEKIKQYCMTDDALAGEMLVANGRIAFGGEESAFQGFKPNRFIRSDAAVVPGRYSYVGYRTEIPDEVVEESLRMDRTPAERWLGGTPTIIRLFALCLGVVLVLRAQFFLLACVLFAAFFAIRAVKRHPAYGTLAARLAEAQLELPSIVVEMHSMREAGDSPPDVL